MILDRERPPAPGGPSLRPVCPIITISVRGYHRRPTPDPAGRVLLAKKVLGELVRSRWTPADVILLPGGFLRLDDPIGHLADGHRAQALLARPVIRALGDLASGLPNTTLFVVGIDLKPLNRQVGGDQFVSAWRAGKLLALARKTFPANGDTDGWGPVYPVYEQDFASASRIIELASGRQALLLGCYDAFGVRGLVHPRFADLTAIRLARDRDGRLYAPSMRERREFLAQWVRLIREHPPDLALVAIHNFIRPGADGYWQRHGLAGASAALGGIPVLGAAHFNEALPGRWTSSVLAAADAPAGHLDLGNRRRPHALAPFDHLTINGKDGRPVALARLFELPTNGTPTRNIS